MYRPSGDQIVLPFPGPTSNILVPAPPLTGITHVPSLRSPTVHLPSGEMATTLPASGTVPRILPCLSRHMYCRCLCWPDTYASNPCAEAAANQLIASGVSVTLWDARVVKPLDPEMLADAARHPCVLTVEDGVREGGIGNAVQDQLAEHTLGEHEPRVRVLGTPIAFIAQAKPDAILSELGLDPAGITASALSLLAGDHVPLTD